MKAVIRVYLAAVVITYGHAWHRFQRSSAFPGNTAGLSACLAMLAGAAWPLYWSTIAWEDHRQ